MHYALYFPSPLESSTVRSTSQNLLPTWLHITFWLSSSIVEKKSQVEDSCDCDVVFEAREGISCRTCSLQISEFFTVAPRSNCALPPRASQSHSLSLVGMYCARPNFVVRRARARHMCEVQYFPCGGRARCAGAGQLCRCKLLV